MSIYVGVIAQLRSRTRLGAIEAQRIALFLIKINYKMFIYKIAFW